MNDLHSPDLGETVDRFVHGAKTMLVGRFLDVEPLFKKGLTIAKNATLALDTTSPSGRDPLLPLLDHENEMVRTIAGAALWQSHTQRARKTIEYVDEWGITEASMLAWKILLFHGRYNPIPSDPGYDGLYDGDHDPKRFHDPAFSARALSGELPATFARKTRIPS